MPKSLANVKAILFDIDQTIWNWRECKKASIEASSFAMSEAGLNLFPRKIRKRIHQIYRENDYEYEHQKVFDDLLRRLKVNPDDIIYDKIKSAATVAYEETERKYLKSYPDVPIALNDLNNMGYKLGVVSDAPSLEGWERLRKMDLLKHFQEDHIRIGKEPKTSKKPFEIIMKQHDYAPNEVVMVGDDPKKDIKPANELGIVTVLFKFCQTYPIDNNDSFQHPDYLVVSIWEFIELLKSAKGISKKVYI